ncbi:MAG: sphingosine kinase [Myxococcales bacterium]|nr:sphingosine kinase [Myxococcales bacterium]
MNVSAGSVGVANSDERAREVREAFVEANVHAAIHVCEPARLAEEAHRVAATGVDAIVAAGGDGTVSAIVGALVDEDVPLAVLPLGTLNHFARDIGMPMDLRDAARAIARRSVKRIDVGEVNGRVFVNNSSIGLYPEIVLSRDEERLRRKRSRWRAMVIAAVRVLRRFPLLVARVRTSDKDVVSKTPFVFVGNNPYTINVLALGRRAELDTGKLSLYLVRAKGRLQMFWLLVRAMLQRLNAIRDFEVLIADEVWIDIHGKHVRVAIDGEVVAMRSPLHYRARPRALSVIVGDSAVREDMLAEPVVQRRAAR